MRYTNTLACNTSIFNTQKPALKIKHFQETTSSMKQLGKLKIFTAEMACLNTSLFCKPIQSMNRIELVQSFFNQVASLKDYLNQSINKFEIFQV